MTQAIFLSYSSDDAAAARRICDALRAAGLEVWFDQSELRGGDAWDASIRKQIKECALFVPIISKNTEARSEGYFRLEWRLADQRTHLIGRNKAFLVPVRIDDTRENSADVPESFLNVQWTRLPDGETSPQFCERLKSLMQTGPSSDALVQGTDAPHSTGPLYRGVRWKRLTFIAVAVVAVLAVAVVMSFRNKLQAPLTSDPATAISTNSEVARKLAEQARNIVAAFHSNTAELEAAATLAERALALDSTSADLLAIASQIDARIASSYDRAPERIERARGRYAKAVTFAPTAYEPRLAQAYFQVVVLGQPYSNSADKDLQALRKENPTDFRVVYSLATLRISQDRLEDAISVYGDAARLPAIAGGALAGKAWALSRIGRFDDALQAVTQSIAAKAHPSNLALKIWLQMSWQGDLDGALATMKSMSVDDQLDDVGLATVLSLYRWRREPGNVLKTLAPISREWLTWSVRAPKAALSGDAFEELGQREAARAEWRKALKSVNDRLVAAPNDRWMLEWKAYLLAALGDNATSRQVWKHAVGLPRVLGPLSFERIQRVATHDEIVTELEYRASAPGSSGGALERRPFISAADLRLNPAWDSVRKLPRVQALQARLDQDPRFSPQALPRTSGPGK